MMLLRRHLVAMAWFALVTFLMMRIHVEQHPIHMWNRAMADVAFLSLTLILIVGPVARMQRWFTRLRPYRREFGVAFGVAAFLHVLIYLHGVHGWDVIDLFFAQEEGHATVLRRNTAAAANWVGVIALLYGTVLTVTSNDWSQRTLGKGWKFLQQQSYTLLVVTILHVGIWMYLVYQSPGGFGWWFVGSMVAAVIFQLMGYASTVGKSKRSRRARQEAS